MKLRIGTGILVVLFILIQFINPRLPETGTRGENDFIASGQAPASVQEMIVRACYDCHSMETRYPWYSYVAPVKWLVKHDIEWGRGGMNLSEWGSLEDADKVELLGEISELVQKGEMPLPKYLWLHPDAKLSAEDRQSIVDWADSTANSYFE